MASGNFARWLLILVSPDTATSSSPVWLPRQISHSWIVILLALSGSFAGSWATVGPFTMDSTTSRAS